MNTKPTNTESTTTTQQDERRRGTAIRIHLITGIVLVLASAPSLLTLTPDNSLNYIGNIITLVMGLVSFLSTWISYRRSATRGSLLFISAILFVSLGIPLYANGLGLQAGIIVAVIVASIAATTLPPLAAARASIAGVFVETGVILADLFLPDFGLDKLVSQYVNPFLIAIVLIFLYFVLRQFSSYTFRAKLIIVFILVISLTVSIFATAITTIGRSAVLAQTGANQAELAKSLAESVGATLANEVDFVQIASTQFEETASEASDAYGSDSESVILAQLTQLDEEWRSAGNDTAIIQTVLNNAASGELKEFQNLAPQHVELFITDKYGANIAATNRTSDFYQADEDWWQAAYNSGEGATFISQPEFDESSETFAVLMAIPLFHDGELVGILRSTLNVSAIAVNLIEERVVEIGHADLRISREQLLSNEILTVEEISGLASGTGEFVEIQFEGEQSLVSEKKVIAPAGGPAQSAIEQLNWSVIVHQDISNIFQPIESQTRATIVISMAALLLAVILGYFAAQRLTTPIVDLTHVASQIARGNLAARATVKTQDEIGALSDSFNLMTDQLQETLRHLEQRVADRTTDLNDARLESETRAQKLHAISEISRIISTEQKLDILLTLITRLVSEKFNFYHTGIFLLDDSKRYAVLHAANSEGGQRMLNRGHRLEIGQGIVGNVVKSEVPRIALDVGNDAVYFDNPDLRETRSEMALPLIVKGKIIGALDVQSIRAGEFDKDDLNLLSILADQIAIAIENARLFTVNEQALNEVQTLYSQYLQKEWKQLQTRSTSAGYQQSLRGGGPIETPIESDEIRRVLREGESLVINQNGSETEPTVIMPIKLRGQTIGVLNIKSPGKGRSWNKDEISLIQSVSERIALALENARLFEETNRRAEREKLVSEITGKIRSVNDPQVMIRTAMEELKNVLGASRVQIIPQSSQKSSNNEGK